MVSRSARVLVAPFVLLRKKDPRKEGEEKWILPGFLRHFARPEANWPESRVAFPSSGSRHYGRLAREPLGQWERESIHSLLLPSSASFLRPDSARSDAIKRDPSLDKRVLLSRQRVLAFPPFSNNPLRGRVSVNERLENQRIRELEVGERRRRSR